MSVRRTIGSPDEFGPHLVGTLRQARSNNCGKHHSRDSKDRDPLGYDGDLVPRDHNPIVALFSPTCDSPIGMYEGVGSCQGRGVAWLRCAGER
jgi:hypothetical protein